LQQLQIVLLIVIILIGFFKTLLMKFRFITKNGVVIKLLIYN